MKQGKKQVIGIILTYNCAKLVERTYRKIPKKEFDKIIIVDDGSIDEIVEVAKKMKIKLFTHPHSGYGGNIKFGLKTAMSLGADFMVEIHGDNQYDSSIIPQALSKMRGGYHLILGSRFTNFGQALKDGMPVERFLTNLGFSFIDRLLFRIPLTEFYNGFRVYSRKLIKTIGLENTSDNYFYSFQIIIQAKFHNLKIGEVPVRCSYLDQHTSENFWKAALHSIETFQVFGEYLSAKLGRKTLLFHSESI